MTPETIAAVTGCRDDLAALYAPLIDAAMVRAQIDTPARQAAFLAQLGHESEGFRWMVEIWGPTAAQVRYEPPCSLAAKLGNTQRGDGQRFKGRGPIMVTGRSNYERFGAWSGYPALEFPELLADPRIGFLASAWFWMANGCNEFADRGDFEGLTRRINGGTNGIADRERRWEIAKAALASSTTQEG